MFKLDARYDSKSTTSKIPKMSGDVLLWYSYHRSDNSKCIDKIVILIELLFAMSTTLDKTLTIGILAASISITKLHPISTATNTPPESKLPWIDVTCWLIENCESLKKEVVHYNRANGASTTCEVC